MKLWIGIDNGVSGSISIVSDSGNVSVKRTPVHKELSYTKKRKYINRIDVSRLRKIFKHISKTNKIVLLERPMVNPGRFNATVSALRALEATLIVLEELAIPYQYIDSKEWQKVMLPKGLKGKQLKKAAVIVGKRLFPNFANEKCADSLLIAEYARRKRL